MGILLEFLPYLFQAAKSVPEVLDYINKTRESLKQSGAWTPEAEAAFTQELANLKANPPAWWQPEQS